MSAKSGDADRDARLSMLFLDVTGRRYRMHIDNVPEGTGTFTVRLDASPNEIDLYSNESTFPKKPMLGVFKVEADKLTLCWAIQGARERPRSFAVAEADPTNTVLMVFSRRRVRQ